MRQSVFETRPGRTRRRDVVCEVQAPVGPGENLPSELWIGDNRIDRNVRKVAGLIAPGERGAVGRADNLEDVAERRWSIGVESAHGCVGNGRGRRCRIEGNIKNRAVRQDRVASGNIHPRGLIRTRAQAVADLHVAVIRTNDHG